MTRIEQSGVAGGNAVAEKRIDLSYDRASQWQTVTRYADLAAMKPVATSDYTFDAAERLTALTHAQGVTTLAGYTWTYGAAHRGTEFTSLVDRSVGGRGGESDGEKPRASAAAEAHCRRRAGLEVFRADHAAGDEPPRLAAGQ